MKSNKQLNDLHKFSEAGVMNAWRSDKEEM